MSIDDSTREAMHEMGLNAYEVDAYLALLESGQLTAMEISREAKVPYSKIYDVLNSLKEKGWIRSNETRPFKYHPSRRWRPPHSQNTVLKTSIRPGSKLLPTHYSPFTKNAHPLNAQTSLSFTDNKPS